MPTTSTRVESSTRHANSRIAAALPTTGRKRRFSWPPRLAGEGGMVTSELAIGMFAVGILLTGLVALIASCVNYLELTRTSQMVARSVALGCSPGQASALAAELSPGSTLELEQNGELFEVKVSRGFSFAHLSVPLSAKTYAWQEVQ